MTGVQTCALPICFPVTIGVSKTPQNVPAIELDVTFKVYGTFEQLTALNNYLNREMAKYSQELNKEMWEYTNYGNQVKELEKAGLNPALLYEKAEEVERQHKEDKQKVSAWEQVKQ